MEQVEVFAVLGALETTGIPMWVAGGWGVDALAGRQNREHRDLDLLVDAERLEECLNLLAARGYVVETDWLPVRVEVVAAGRGWVDVHPVRLASDGSGVQAGLDGTQFDYPTDCFTTGNLEGREVPCLTATHQRLLHAGYEPRAQDIHDLRVLGRLNPGMTHDDHPPGDSDRAWSPAPMVIYRGGSSASRSPNSKPVPVTDRRTDTHATRGCRLLATRESMFEGCIRYLGTGLPCGYERQQGIG